MTVRAYIDGFNLYYGALKGTPYRWLDLATLCDALAGASVVGVTYCTARLKARTDDPGLTARQNAYLHALEGQARVTVLYGKFKEGPVRLRRLSDDGCSCCEGRLRPKCACCTGSTIGVIRSEEKGSDVQLGVQLVKDAYERSIDAALIVSNDSDLQPAIDIARSLKVHVTVVNPRIGGHNALSGSSRRHISRGMLHRAQFPEEVLLPNGRRVRRPAEWK